MTISACDVSSSGCLGLSARLRAPTVNTVLTAAAALVVALLLLAIWQVPSDLSFSGRIALATTLLCVAGWTLTRLPDSIVALAGALALVVTGAFPQERFYTALGHEMVWLLVAAFLLAAVLRSSGLLENLSTKVLGRFATIQSLFYTLAGVIAITAFVVPSTSGRAALLLPVFWSLAARLPDPQLVRPLALLFPTTILLSAGGSLIGAGAHFVAVDAIASVTGQTIGFVQWTLLAFPMTTLATLAATWLIIRMFVPAELRNATVAVAAGPTTGLTSIQKRIAFVFCIIVGLWVSTPLHGLGTALVAMSGAALLLLPSFTSQKTKDSFKQIEIELLVFLTTTLIVSDALLASGASTWLANKLVSGLPEAATASFPLVAAFVAAVSILAHLVINSRTARAAVLVPAFALPLAGMGHDVALLVLLTVLGTGFCQSTMASAKPVAVYGNLECKTFTQADLLRLAGPLMAVKFGLLIVFGLLVWPSQLASPASTPPKLEARVATVLTRPVPAAPQAAPQPMPGALCTRDELALVMLATIKQNRMWASGWWRVWRKLDRGGIAVERSAVKAIYRGDKMVKLRRHSTAIARIDGDEAAVAGAFAACSGKKPVALE